jgi:hypothetical protein
VPTIVLLVGPPYFLVLEFNTIGTADEARATRSKPVRRISDLPSPAEAGFAKAGA